MQSQNRKKRQRAKRKENKTKDWKRYIRDVKIKETRLGSYEELYITGIKNIIRTKSKNEFNSTNYKK